MAKARKASIKETPPAEVEYSLALAQLICDRIAEGESTIKIGRDPAMPSKRTIMYWLSRHEEFQALYAIATELRGEALVEEGLEIIDDASRDYVARKNADGSEGEPIVDHEHVSRSKARADYRKWMAGQLHPKKYGDKVDLNHSGSIAVTDIDRPPRETREEWLARRTREMGAAAGPAD